MPSDIELVKLKARIADIDEEIQKLKPNRLLSAGQKLLKEHACKRERRKLELRIQLFREGEQIKRLEGQCEFYQTALGKAVIEGKRHRAEERRQKVLAASALGLGGYYPPHTHSHKKTFSYPQIRRRLHP